MKLWICNFNSQLANALIIEGDYQNSISALECGYICAAQISYPELQVLFSAIIPLFISMFLFRIRIIDISLIARRIAVYRCSLQLPYCTCT